MNRGNAVSDALVFPLPNLWWNWSPDSKMMKFIRNLDISRLYGRVKVAILESLVFQKLIKEKTQLRNSW